jgi:hypothetical protein
MGFMEGAAVDVPGGILGWKDLSEEYSQRLRVLNLSEAAALG